MVYGRLSVYLAYEITAHDFPCVLTVRANKALLLQILHPLTLIVKLGIHIIGYNNTDIYLLVCSY